MTGPRRPTSGVGRSRRPLLVSAVSLLLAGLVAAFAPATAAPGAEVGAADGGAAVDRVAGRTASSFSATKVLTRVFENADGTSYEFPANTVTVTASETRNLRGRQRITICLLYTSPSPRD